MPFNGSGSFSIVNTFVPGTTILSSTVNQNFSDIATGLSTTVLKNGTQIITDDIPMAAHKFTGLAAGTTAGDSVRFEQLPPTSGGVLLTSGTVSAAATLDIVLTSYTSYRAIKFMLTALIPATTDVALWMRFSTNGGSSYNAGASDYSYATFVSYAADDSSAGDSKIILVPLVSIFGISNAATGGVSLEATLYDQTSTTRYSAVRSTALPVYTGIAGPLVEANGYRNTAQDTDAVRFLFSSGNIASGKYAVYGYN